MADLSELRKHQNYQLYLAKLAKVMASDVNITNVLVSNWLRFSTGNALGAILARDFKAARCLDVRRQTLTNGGSRISLLHTVTHGSGSLQTGLSLSGHRLRSTYGILNGIISRDRNPDIMSPGRYPGSASGIIPDH